MAENVDSTSNQLDERLIIDHSGYALYRDQQNSCVVRVQPPSVGMALSQDKFSVNTEGFDNLQHDQDPAEEISDLQAQFCPTTVNACSPLTRKWFSVSIANLTDMVWAKDSAKALVMEDSRTKDTLFQLIQAHKSAYSGEAPSDVIEGKGQVNCSQPFDP